MASRNLNKVILIGNLTRDPEMRYTPQGNAVASFVVATNREWVVAGERKQSVDFHNIVAWNKLAEICAQLLKKGTKVYVEGRLQTRDWTDTTGIKKYKTEVIIEDMIVLTFAKNGEESHEHEAEEGHVTADSAAPQASMPQDTGDIDLSDINLDDLDTGTAN